MQNYTDTLLSQYANSPTITALITDFNEWIDPTIDLNNFYSNIFNVLTCDDYGLDCWGKIVNVSRYVQITQSPVDLGFKEAYTVLTATTGAQPFGQAPMYDGLVSTLNFRLATEVYRKLILVKAMTNITNCTVPSLNKLLNYLFAGEGRCYVVDTGSMQLRYVFEFNLTASELSIMLYSGAIPRPAGVQASVMQITPSQTFGFNGQGQPFGSGVFFNPTIGLQNVS